MRLALVTLFFLLVMPLSANAAFGFVQIVPNACDCTEVPVQGGGSVQSSPSAPAWGCVLQVVQNVIRVAIALGIAVATLALVYAGFVWMTSGGSAERRNQGSHLLLNVFIGLAIMLGAWLIVDFIMKELYREPTEFGPWNNILGPNGNSQAYCIIARAPQPIAEGTVALITAQPSEGGGGSVSSPVAGTPGCPTCVRLEGFACTNNCTIDPAVRDRLVNLVRTFNGTWVVTEAYPPTARHTNQCHNNGTCIDAAFRSPTTYTAQNISAFAQAASGAGLRTVFETQSCSLRDTARQAGVTAYCSSDSGYSHITGNHFSVYSH